MSRYPLRDIAGSLAGAADLESALAALLSYLRAVQSDWLPTVALYEPQRERFERVYRLDRQRLLRIDHQIALAQLPARLVRKFIHPSAFFNVDGRRSLLEKLFHGSVAYEPDPFESAQLQPLTAPVAWRSCTCLPLNDRDELLGLIVLVSERPKAFGSTVVEALQPLRGLASLAIARRLQATGRPTPEARDAEEASRRTQVALQQRLRELEDEMGQLAAESEARGATLSLLAREAETLRAGTASHHDERQHQARQTQALEDQVGAAGELLSEAYAQLAASQSRCGELEHTLAVVREAFDVIAQGDNAGEVTRSFVAWFCDRFNVGRCSLMRLDDERGDLRILAHRGMDPAMAPQVRVPMGEGVAGWVARHRRPVLRRDRDENATVRATGLDHYNSDSFMSLPLLHRGRVLGVLNLSNKQDGESFDDLDLDRAQLASHVLAMTLGEARERAAA